MTTKEIYNLAVQMGVLSDLRGTDSVAKFLQLRKDKYAKLSPEEKAEFDVTDLENPYTDSRILNISENKEIKRVLVGIDIEPAEILLAKELGNIDLVISHHPLGKALATLADVMHLQAEVLSLYGVPINIAEGLMREKISEVARGVSRANHQRTVDAAKLLNFNLMCLHTVCDNLVARFLKNEVEARQPEKLKDLVSLLEEFPEYKEAKKNGVGPRIFVGNPEASCGKIAVTEITGGTEGSPKLFEKIANAGVGTVIGMHISEEHKKEAELAHLNVVIAGHMSSDSLGVNLFLDEIEKRGVQVVPCSGLIRVKRS